MTALWMVAIVPDCVGKQSREVARLSSLESPLRNAMVEELLKRCVLPR